MSNVLITGGCGMVGSHLIEFYHSKGIKPIATFHNPTIDITEVADKCEYHPCDVRDRDSVHALIHNYLPDVIYHLAAQSYPALSWEIPIETFETNANGTINVFESIKKIREHAPGYDPVVIVACSSAQYGSTLIKHPEPVTEEAEMLPLHPYGVSKVAQDLLAYQYHTTFGIKCIRARIFNTTGVRKVNDVVSDFTKRAVQLEKGLTDKFICGNLSTKRAITDVRDLINALYKLSSDGVYGEAYNISGKHIYQVKDIISIIEEVTGITINAEVDAVLMRPLDEPIIYGNSQKLIAATGWQQEIPLKQTITDMIGYWRTKL
ncbi:MAG: hypothetical protein BGO70_02725 [Bacteroidetes bacterium 43-93]|nr:GDP-mannose 4,6-dehydratase [Bacteroidota bacterium]OJW99210.1 MAG: hypothetical protein BGO70_02725 [Bacteroidetes bacterium 43-93]